MCKDNYKNSVYEKLIEDLKNEELLNALCIINCGWKTAEDEILYRNARELVWKRFQKIKATNELILAKEKLDELKDG